MTNLIDKATYQKPQKADLRKWKKLINKSSLTIKDVYDSFNEKYPNTLTYDGFYKSLYKAKIGFTYNNYVKAKRFFTNLQNQIEI